MGDRIRLFVQLLAATLLLASASAGAFAQTSEISTLTAQLSSLYKAGRYAEAAIVGEVIVRLTEEAVGPQDRRLANALNNQAEMLRHMARHADAAPLYLRAIAILEKNGGPDDPGLGNILNNLGELLRADGRYGDAERVYLRAASVVEKTKGPQDALLATPLNNLGELYRMQGRYIDAERAYKRSLVIMEATLGPNHINVASTLNNLALLYRAQERNIDAEPLMKRTIAVLEENLGQGHPAIATSRSNLAELYQGLGQTAAAEAIYETVIDLLTANQMTSHPEMARVRNNIGLLQLNKGELAAAERSFELALAIYEGTLGADHPVVSTLLHNIGGVNLSANRLDVAEQRLTRALALREATLGAEHPGTGLTLNLLAELHAARGDWPRAVQHLWRSTSGVVARVRRSNAEDRGDSRGARDEHSQWSYRFKNLVGATYNALVSSPDVYGRADVNKATYDMFVVAQWAQSSGAATSLAQMAARGANSNAALAPMLRERQDLVAEWEKRDGARVEAMTLPTERRSRPAEAANNARLAEIDRRLAAIDTRMAQDFPDFAALSQPEPAGIGEVQADLLPHEVLVMFLDTPATSMQPDQTFIWAVTKTDVRWARTRAGSAALAREVAALRCGLDATAWLDTAACVTLAAGAFTAADAEAGKPLPFDHARAHRLYMDLFGNIRDMIADKHILLVPSGPLAQLPFQVLVSEAPQPGSTHASVRWLVRDNATTVLPAVASLRALRRLSRASAATREMIGFGNPLLDGDQDHPRYGQHYRATAAHARQQSGCAPAGIAGSVATRALRRSTAPSEPQRQAGRVDLAEIRRQSPLPETADELCAVARDLGVDQQEIKLGAAATERAIKAMSADGSLARYRVVHFATHGTLAGQLSGTSEPGLLLTPPQVASDVDDGYLSASEIATLKLDADWVILSACNTAGGSAAGQGGEALSGLSRAFFYAQARALLVSHWEVNSQSTVKLITAAVKALARDREIGRAEALRTAMLALIDGAEPADTHPAHWAPFVVVGEGGGSRVAASTPPRPPVSLPTATAAPAVVPAAVAPAADARAEVAPLPTATAAPAVVPAAVAPAADARAEVAPLPADPPQLVPLVPAVPAKKASKAPAAKKQPAAPTDDWTSTFFNR